MRYRIWGLLLCLFWASQANAALTVLKEHPRLVVGKVEGSHRTVLIIGGYNRTEKDFEGAVEVGNREGVNVAILQPRTEIGFYEGSIAELLSDYGQSVALLHSDLSRDGLFTIAESMSFINERWHQLNYSTARQLGMISYWNPMMNLNDFLIRDSEFGTGPSSEMATIRIILGNTRRPHGVPDSSRTKGLAKNILAITKAIERQTDLRDRSRTPTVFIFATNDPNLNLDQIKEYRGRLDAYGINTDVVALEVRGNAHDLLGRVGSDEKITRIFVEHLPVRNCRALARFVARR